MIHPPAPMMLFKHPWDTRRHVLQVFSAFEAYQDAYAKDQVDKAARALATLKQLTDEAKVREAALFARVRS